MNREISAAEGQALLRMVDHLIHQPAPANPRAYGCLSIVIAVALFLGFPRLATALGWGRAPGLAALRSARCETRIP